jgi:hypothetical protein
MIAIVAGSQLKGQVILRVRRKIVPDSLSLRLMGVENTIVWRAPRASR